MIGKLLGRAVFAGILAGMLIVVQPLASSSSQAFAGAACDRIEREFKRSARPRFLRVVNRNRSLANWYNATLRRLKAGKNPTRGEIKKTYRMLVARCASSNSPARCRSFARSMHNAAQQLYNYNRRWLNAGCRGTLSG